ncbi:MAG TPA: tetratricopeptide repeat protein [bacterium]|nr:tetratricopeptide repeat protein [bacterium]
MRRVAALVVLAAVILIPQASAQAKRASDPRALYESGQALLASGDTYRAIDAFTEAVTINPGYADAWAALADCQYQLGEYERCIAFIEKAYGYGPRVPSLVTLEGFARIGMGATDDARKRFEETLGRLPNDRDARFGLALLDLRSGRPADAKARLAASLKTAPRDARALLSLALISRAEGRADESAAYLTEALRWSSGDAAASYAAAGMYAEQGDPVEAARLARAAIEVRPAYAQARGLLASLYYERGALDDARTILDGSIKYDRSDSQAWFLLGLVETAAGRRVEAEYAFQTLAAQRPDDELARIALENLAMDDTTFEDPSRADLAAWRFARAADFERRLLYDKAIAEYRRGLAINPYANDGRRRYADLLRGSRLSTSYLSELRFLADIGKSDQALSDAIEIYDSLLQGSVSRSWKVSGASLPSNPYRIAIFSVGPGGTPYHAGSDMVIARYLRDALAFVPGLAPERGVPRVPSFADAFRLARESGADWFVLVAVAESERDVVVSAELHAARTGALAASFQAPRSGNDRVALAVASVVRSIRENLPVRGTLISRSGDMGLVDLGRADGIAVGDSFLIVKNGGVSIRPDGQGIAWNDADVVARIIVKRLDDELFEGSIERVGFFDRVNPRDTVVREPKPAAAAAVPKTPGKTTATPAASAPALPSSYVWTALYERVRSLY